MGKQINKGKNATLWERRKQKLGVKFPKQKKKKKKNWSKKKS